MIARILVALDGSERAPGVLATALDLGRRFGAKVQPLRAISIPPEFPPAAAGTPKDRLPQVLEDAAREELGRLVARFPDAAVEPPVIRSGVPWRVIIDTADELDADLIVIGSHGYRGWDRVLGTNTDKVVNFCTRSVLVVQDRPRRQP